MPVQHSPPTAKRPRTPPENEPSDQSNRSQESLLPSDFETKDEDDLIAIDLKNLRLSHTPTHSTRRTTVMAKSSDEKIEPRTAAAVKDNDSKVDPRDPTEDEGTDCATSISQMTRARADIDKYVKRIEKLESDGSNVTRWKQRTSKAVYHMTGVPSYWEGDKPDLESPYEMAVDQCALRVIEETVPDDISDLIGTIVLAHEAMSIIEDQFRQGGRTAQMVTFRELIFRTFDPATMSVSEYTASIDKALNRLESEGVVWTRDCLAGLLYQLGAPTFGEFSMEGVNTALDAQYQNNLRPFMAREVRTQMQSVVTNRKAAQKADVIVKAMATKTIFKNPMRPFPSTSTIQSPTPLSENTEERDMSINNLIPIPKSAAAECHNRDEQCYHCRKFKHTKDRCVWSRS
ncbi:hypothetical protein CROQUDRAFT_611747 [Cronartium quercuum f. sp. fusiforme G11]|uniref:Uncharacterized protein n=1 Tax=Cronartium quercuum f. sp. fusiforme G11 TaxID=708437 RepID=A0A9P6TBK1_9BASI|nr:hypothetical protein CROQUDRAFT_611747 [Cronartium quercuum f. sp. fusiforme G11]